MGACRRFRSLSRRWCGVLSVAIAGWLLGTGGAAAAERALLKAGPLQREVSVRDLDRWARTGDVPPSLHLFRPLLTPRLRAMLTQRIRVDPSLAHKVVSSALQAPEIEQAIAQLGVALPGSSVEQLKVTLYLALREPEGLSAVSFLRLYPRDRLVLDLLAATRVALHVNAPTLERQVLSPVLTRELTVAPTALPGDRDPTASGPHPYRHQPLVMYDRRRDRAIPIELYFPPNPRGPLVVFSHGYAADSRFLEYLAIHLASHGISSVALEHPGSNATAVSNLPSGLPPSELLHATEFLDRPRDISFILNELERINRYSTFWRGKFDSNNVTVVGHSLGGYTALALAGGRLDVASLRHHCREANLLGRSPADWLQCTAAELPQRRAPLRDRRVRQAIALNPAAAELFGSDGLREVRVPVAILSSSEDAIAPALRHQLRPFRQLGGEKYLLMAFGGTHMSATDLSNLHSPVAQSTLVREVMGPESEPVRAWTRAVTLSFVLQRTADAETYQPFLTPEYAQFLSTPQFRLRLARQLPPTAAAWLRGLDAGQTFLSARRPAPTVPVAATPSLPVAPPTQTAGAIGPILTRLARQAP